MQARVPVTVVTGFLGAGKTTLVHHWLGEAPRGDIAVIVNEHGDIGIDGALLQARVRMIVEIAGGCICCATQTELARALERLAFASAPPKRILIETSGAASPAGVIHTIRGGERAGTFELDGIITVVDASRLDRLSAHELAIEQIGYADVVVLSRADVCDEAQQRRAVETVTAWSGAAVIAPAARGVFTDPARSTLEGLLDRRRAAFEALRVPRAPALPHAHPVYESISLVHDGALDGERFADFVESEVARFAGRLFRTKGILAIDGVDERMIVQGVADAVEVTFGERWGNDRLTSRFVIVGYDLDRSALERAFAACAA